MRRVKKRETYLIFENNALRGIYFLETGELFEWRSTKALACYIWFKCERI